MTPQEQNEIRARQKSRSKVMAILLIAFCVLMFAITIAKIKAGMVP